MSIIDVHPNLKQLSNSSSVLLHKCPRKYELYKLLPLNRSVETGDEHLDFGTIVGIGVQEILINGSYEAALWKMFNTWPNMLDADEGARARKTFWHAVYCVEKFLTYRKTVLGNYELAYFEGKPAVELGFTVDLGDGFYYRGKVDAVLINKMTNELVVLECKTTKNVDIHEAQYKHSGQALGYALVLDTLEHLLDIPEKSATRVKYCIYKTYRYEWEDLPFTKTLSQRALWIKNILVDKESVVRYATDSYFPMHGENCYDFFRPCTYFGICELQNSSMMRGPPEIREDKVGEYQFKFNIVDIIDAQIARQARS